MRHERKETLSRLIAFMMQWIFLLKAIYCLSLAIASGFERENVYQ
jgi:hypothetical protein